jgi:hypothetical protein
MVEGTQGMKKTLIVVMELEVSDLSQEERRENADMQDCKPSELPNVRELSAFDVAQVLLPDEDDAEMFAGSDIYAKFTNARLLAWNWKPKA